MNIPNDPIMLLSFINTKLRDFYPNLYVLCDELELSSDDIINKLSLIDYCYDAGRNQFTEDAQE